MTSITITLLALFPIYSALKDAFMFRDLGTGNNGHDPNAKQIWHALDFAWQVLLIAALAWAGTSTAENHLWAFAGTALAASAWFWIANDALINVVGLGKPIFYIGTTSTIDKLLRRLFGADAGFYLAGLKTGLVLGGAVLAYFSF